jgi:NitT/TauT family transport system permease protein
VIRGKGRAPWLLVLLPWAGVLLLWYLVRVSGIVSPALVPSPLQVLGQF